MKLSRSESGLSFSVMVVLQHWDGFWILSVGFRSDDYVHYEVRGVRIFEYKKLVTKQNVKRRLEQWLRSIPDKDLDAIERIYIIRKEDLAALGSYARILYCINLAWDNPSALWNPISWLNNYTIESTL